MHMNISAKDFNMDNSVLASNDTVFHITITFGGIKLLLFSIFTNIAHHIIICISYNICLEFAVFRPTRESRYHICILRLFRFIFFQS